MLDYIRRLEHAMASKEYSQAYIAQCVNYAYKLKNKKLPVIFDTEHFAKLVGYDSAEEFNLLLESKMYEYKEIPKKNGYRILSIPHHNLKTIQKWMLENLISKIQVSPNSRGFIKNTSLYDNAIKHIGKDVVITLDIKDFYPSIKKANIYRIFRGLGYTQEISKTFTDLTMTNSGLPQGAPTSPYLAHIVCKKLDKKITDLLNGLNACDFTRYADDITISGNVEIIKKIDGIIGILNSEGFEVNHYKTRIQPSSRKQLVTGLVVNKKVNIPRSYIRRIKQEIYYCKKFGVNSHMEKEGIYKSNYKLYLFGKAYYIKMINPELGEKLLNDLYSVDWPY